MSTYKLENSAVRIELGPDSLNQLPELLAQCGSKVLLVHGHRPVEDGLLVKVRLLLNQAGFPHANMGQILPNPKYGSVKRGIKTARKENCDIILSLGGGSTLQCAKAIALGLHYKGDVWDFWTGKKKAANVCPIASILTNPASGAELSQGCTIVRKGVQKTIHSPLLACRFAILDPKLSQYPFYPTMNQTFVLFLHLFFAWLEKPGAQKQEALLLLKSLFACLKQLEARISDVGARTELYRVGLLSHSQIDDVTLGFEKLSGALSFAFSLPEGSAASALFPAWCDRQNDEVQAQIAALAAALFGLENASYEQAMAAFKKAFTAMQMPLSLPEAGLEVSSRQLGRIASSKSEKALLHAANQ